MYIAAAGLACPVGLSAAAACAAMRAGVAKFDEWPYHHTAGGAIVGAAVPGLDFKTKRLPRLAELLAGAVTDCLAGAAGLRTEQVPLLLGTAEPGRPGGVAPDAVAAGLGAKLKARFHPKLSRTFPTGHTAGFEALRAARDLLTGGGAPACLVAAADSYANAEVLAWLDAHARLKTPDNSNGAIPGEAGAAVLVQATPPRDPTARVAGLGFAQEKATVLSDEPLLGLGLAEATRQALADASLPLHEIDFRLSDVTGETYGFKEQALLLPRVMRGRREAFPLWHCADCIGDTGAAAGVCQLAVALYAFRKNYAPGPRAIGFTSSVPGGRAAAVLLRHPPPGPGLK
jgi:3-oxoacyl-[acyl-carrier-protein] synthase-1